jgi:hypothetical protein
MILDFLPTGFYGFKRIGAGFFVLSHFLSLRGLEANSPIRRGETRPKET